MERLPSTIADGEMAHSHTQSVPFPMTFSRVLTCQLIESPKSWQPFPRTTQFPVSHSHVEGLIYFRPIFMNNREYAQWRIRGQNYIIGSSQPFALSSMVTARKKTTTVLLFPSKCNIQHNPLLEPSTMRLTLPSQSCHGYALLTGLKNITT